MIGQRWELEQLLVAPRLRRAPERRHQQAHRIDNVLDVLEPRTERGIFENGSGALQRCDQALGFGPRRRVLAGLSQSSGMPFQGTDPREQGCPAL